MILMRCAGARPEIWKGGGAQCPVSVFTENIGEVQKKGLHVVRRPIYPPKSSEDQKKVSTSFVLQFSPQNQVKTK